jgi:hypothetical protein
LAGDTSSFGFVVVLDFDVEEVVDTLYVGRRVGGQLAPEEVLCCLDNDMGIRASVSKGVDACSTTRSLRIGPGDRCLRRAHPQLLKFILGLG